VITGGLRPGERIIVEGLQRVRDSVRVTTRPWVPPADSARQAMSAPATPAADTAKAGTDTAKAAAPAPRTN
jgi:membrane fusion protein (multidrug efflux system)